MGYSVEQAAILAMLERYKHAIHTQEAEDFLPLWAEGVETVLISPSGYYAGTENIYQHFLLDGIRRAYSRIDLLSHSAEVRILSEDLAIVVFSYSTDCDRRETGEFFSIAGLETQVYCRQQGQWKLCHVHYSVQRD